jgi:hypothetical protein
MSTVLRVLPPKNFSQHAVVGLLLQPSVQRGFVGTLSNVQTPFGLATMSSASQGLSIALQK